ncbi:hypothetical protein M0534_03875 [Methylonatrum kenyense]|uniref:hypothetical protein n=1 Tax=Methylonatrum kenyense TaxID=455253 RepID=UPI0020C0780E|nr:hypothetical protein [Methylonatrum kenyense]MCK8515472.1 hypothetical protein [Methylonatrum kenyense]
MKMRLLTLLFGIAFGSVAWAHACPSVMAEIDAILEGDEVPSHVEADVLAEAKALREDGERYHDAGKHAEAMDALERSLALLGGEGDEDVYEE